MKPPLLDALLVVDVEATCYEDGTAPLGFVPEIIEVGVAVLSVASLEITETWSALVRPIRTTVSPFCEALTGHTQRRLEQEGRSFREVVNLLQSRYHSRRRSWASWGNYDRMMFENGCKEHAIPYPFGDTHYNVKNMVALAAGWDRTVGMSAAAAELDFLLSGKLHRGVDDAENIAGLLALVLTGARFSLLPIKEQERRL
jgi:inhibitor of KinA sporulation pathway (predicted exonuclease)